MIIRTETSSDFDAIDQLNVRAFGNRGDESRLIERIRASEQYVPDLSLVAEIDREIVGHAMLSKAVIREQDRDTTVIVLAPIAVKPEFQKQGIGSKLIEEGISRCKSMGYGLVLLIGHPGYYPRLGFRPARQFGLELRQFDVPDDVFMVYEVEQGKLQEISGELLYPNAFLSGKES